MSELGAGLFARTPTDAEKIHYRQAWGAVPPLRCLAGMAMMLLAGVLLGLALG